VEEEITLRATYLHPEGNSSGTFLIAREDVDALNAWRTDHGIPTEVMRLEDPATGEALPAFRPVEGNQLARVERERNIAHGQRCRVTYKVKQQVVDLRFGSLMSSRMRTESRGAWTSR
jgi:hypothetical protein